MNVFPYEKGDDLSDRILSGYWPWALVVLALIGVGIWLVC